MKKERSLTWVCTNCGSMNVQQKMWVNLNTFNPDLDSEFNDYEDFWCMDCEGHHEVIAKVLKCYNGRPRIEGYQVVSFDDNSNIHPDMEGSFCLYSLEQARSMIEKDGHMKWKLLTCYKGDVEEPTLMFKK